MHHIGNQRLNHQLQRFAESRTPEPACDLTTNQRVGDNARHHGIAHDMLVMSSRPDLTPEFPAGLRHPTQSDCETLPSQLRR